MPPVYDMFADSESDEEEVEKNKKRKDTSEEPVNKKKQKVEEKEIPKVEEPKEEEEIYEPEDDDLELIDEEELENEVRLKLEQLIDLNQITIKGSDCPKFITSFRQCN